MTTLTVVLLVLATARLTLLVTTDAILEPVRSAIEKRLGDDSKIAYLIRCNWCVSVWIGVFVFVVGWYAPTTAVLIGSGALTASLVTGWLSLVSQWIDASTGKLWNDIDTGNTQAATESTEDK